MAKGQSGIGLEEARVAIDDADHKMAALFTQRMKAVADVAAYKAEHGLPILDREREAQVLERNSVRVEEELRPYYRRFLEALMAESRNYQQQLIGKDSPSDSSQG